MQFKLPSGEQIILPDMIYVDQLAEIDLAPLDKYLKVKDDDLSLSDLGPILTVFTKIFEKIGCKHHWTVAEITTLVKDEVFKNWMRSLFGVF